MLDEKVLLSMVKECTNGSNKLSEDKFLDMVSGLEEEEVEEALAVLAANNIEFIEEEADETGFTGDYEKLQKLTNEELCVMYRRGDKTALEALIAKNVGLVRGVANRILKNYSPEILDEEDLYIAGDMGLMTAAGKFDVSKSFKFSTYASWWIRQSVTREVMDHGYGMRLPVHVFEQVIKVNKVRRMLKDGTVEEIRDKLNSEYCRCYSIEEVEDYIMYGEKYLNTASLNKVIGGEDGDTELMDLLPLETNVEDEVMDHAATEEIYKALNTLREKEREVILMRFGLGGYYPMTLEEIGGIYHVTRERIRQIEEKALSKLRHPSRSYRLEAFYAA